MNPVLKNEMNEINAMRILFCKYYLVDLTKEISCEVHVVAQSSKILKKTRYKLA